MNAPDKPPRGQEPPPALPSMLRQRRLCRIALSKLTNEIGQRYAREARPGNE